MRNLSGKLVTLVKHTIKVTDTVPFKERYRRITPNQFEEVRKHLKEMLGVAAVLVRKKDGSLGFCIDIRKVNARMVKDPYALQRIDDTLNRLNGTVLFSALYLKSGYLQVELDEQSTPLTTFMVGPIGSSECKRMPLG